MSNLTLEEKYKSNDIQYELGRNFIEYAVAVNTDRSIPDAKSGLKPVARRILWGSYVGGRTSNKAHVKCARIVGDVMGSLHPHGDSSIYGALVRLAQLWVIRNINAIIAATAMLAITPIRQNTITSRP